MSKLAFLSGILVCLSLGAQDYPQDYFRPPLDIELISSGTFGELRGNHFHSGLDIKTQGRTGLKVYAVAEGSISRIKVSPYGFGRAIYLRHPNGFTSVYAHLAKFSPEIEAYVVEEMKRKKSNEVNLFPAVDQFQVAQGEVIAFSGNSGGSGGPHLHFEIRDTRTEKIINPLLFGFEVADSRHPDLSDLQVYFFEDDISVGQREYRLLDQGSGKYHISGEGRVQANDAVGFGIYAIDRQDRANNRNGIYSLKLFVNDELHYHYEMETFAFAETRYINAHIDYALKACCRKTLHRLHRLPGNKLSLYKNEKDGSPLRFERDTVVDIRIEAADLAGNSSELQFELDYHYQPSMASAEEPHDPQSTEVFKQLPTDWPKMTQVNWQEAIEIKDIRHRINIPAEAFYHDLILERSQEPACQDCLSSTLSLGSESVPVHRYYDLALKVDYLPKYIDPQKLFIASFREGRFLDYEGGSYVDGWVYARTRQLGDFAVMVDSTAPRIQSIDFKEGSNLARNKILQVRVRDDLSGVDKYNAWVDGTWVPVYFDAKTARLLIDTQHWPASETKQELILRVEDSKGNESSAKWSLFGA